MKIITKYALLLAIMGGFASCTDYDTPPNVEEGNSNTGTGNLNVKNYVLWVNIEGAGGGDLVKNALPDNGTVKGILPKSVYLWDGLEAEHIELNDRVSDGSENPIASASLLTGNTPYRHGISEATYTSEVVYDPDYDEAMKAYSSFFQYISDYDKSIHTLAVTPWQMQNKNLLFNATRTVTSTSDEETLEEGLSSLQEGDNRVVYLSFKSVLEAAVSGGGWQAGNSQYKEAMQKVDGYIGQLLETIKGRNDAYYEDWLVIVTSNHGGKEDGTYGGNSPEERKMFGVFYYPHFSKPRELRGETIEVMRFDQSFRGVVIDSVTSKAWTELDVPCNRQVYSIDTLGVEGGGITVQMLMASRPSKSRSYIPGDQNGVTLLKKGKWTQKLTHTYCASEANFYSLTDGRTGSSSKYGDFVDPTIHSYTMSMRFKNSEDYDEVVKGEEDQWGVIQPDKINKKRRGARDMRNYFDGIPRTEGIYDQAIDQATSWYRDNANLEIMDGLRWSCRYIVELRIWNKMLDATRVKMYSDQLKLNEANCPDYKNLIGYWQFYKGQNGEYLKDDSLVINQIKEVTKRDGTKVPGEPIRLRKKTEDGKYVPIEESDVCYETIHNSLYQNMVDGKRIMESSTVVPVLLNWLGIGYPTEKTRDSGFNLSKLDGVWYPLDSETNKFIWKWMVLGDYKNDLEWRDKTEEKN